MSNNRAVKLRDAIILAVIVLNFGFFRWRATHANDQPTRAITSVSASDIIGNPANELGDPNAKYALVEFGDYQCPPCASLFPEIDALLARNRRNLRFQFRHYPLPGHLLAFPAAMLAESARRSGQFEAVHRALYALDSKLTEQNLRAIASKYSVAYPPPSPSDALYKQLEPPIANDKLMANKVPIHGTPSLFLCTPDQNVIEVHNASQIEELIR